MCELEVTETVDHFLLHCCSFDRERAAMQRAVLTACGRPLQHGLARAAGQVGRDDIWRGILLGADRHSWLQPTGKRPPPGASKATGLPTAADAACSSFLRSICRRRSQAAATSANESAGSPSSV